MERSKLAEIAEREAKLNLVWAVGGPARKYTKDFEPVFGQGRFAWCGAFVRWCCKEAGLNIPINAPSGFGYTFALVEAWQQWAIQQKFYIDHDGKFAPTAGDIVIFDWDQKSIDQPDLNWDSHVAVFLRRNGELYQTAEGNSGNMTAVRNQKSRFIQGYIRIPAEFKF